MTIGNNIDINPPSVLDKAQDLLKNQPDPAAELGKIKASVSAKGEVKDLNKQLDTLNILNPTEFNEFIENLEKMNLSKGERIATWIRLLQRLNMNLVGIKKLDFNGGKPNIQLFLHEDSKISVVFLGSYQKSINKFLESSGGNTSEFFTAAMARTSNFSDFLSEQGKKGTFPKDIKPRDHFRNLLKKYGLITSDNFEKVVMTTEMNEDMQRLLNTVESTNTVTQADKEYIRLYVDSLGRGKKEIKVDLPGEIDLKKAELAPFAGKIAEISADKKLLGKGENKLQNMVGSATTGILLGYLFGQLSGGKSSKNYAIAFGAMGALYGGADEKTKEKAKYLFGRTFGLIKDRKKTDGPEIEREFVNAGSEEAKNITIREKYRDISVPENLSENEKQYYNYSYESIFSNDDFLSADSKTIFGIFNKYANYSDIKDDKDKTFLVSIGLGTNFLFDSRNYQYYKKIIKTLEENKKSAIGEPNNGENFINYLSRTDRVGVPTEETASANLQAQEQHNADRTPRTEMLNLSSKDLLRKLAPNSPEVEKIAHNLELYNIDLKSLLTQYIGIIDLCDLSIQEKLKSVIFIRMKRVSNYIDDLHKSYFNREPNGNESIAVSQYKRMVSERLHEELGKTASNPKLSELFFDALAYTKYLNGSLSEKFKATYKENFEGLKAMFSSKVNNEGKFEKSQKAFSKDVNSADLELNGVKTDFSDYLKILTKEEEDIESKAFNYSLIIGLASLIGTGAGTFGNIKSLNYSMLALDGVYSLGTLVTSYTKNEDLHLYLLKKAGLVNENYRRDPTTTDNLISLLGVVLPGFAVAGGARGILGGAEKAVDAARYSRMASIVMEKLEASGGLTKLQELGKSFNVKKEFILKIRNNLNELRKNATVSTSILKDIFVSKKVNMYNGLKNGQSMTEGTTIVNRISESHFEAIEGSTRTTFASSKELAEFLFRKAKGNPTEIEKVVYGAGKLDDALSLAFRNGIIGKGIGKINPTEISAAMKASISKTEGKTVKIGDTIFDDIIEEGGKLKFIGKDSAGNNYLATIEEIMFGLNKNSISDIYSLLSRTKTIAYDTSKFGKINVSYDAASGFKAMSNGKILNDVEVQKLFTDKKFLETAAKNFIDGVIAYEKAGGALGVKISELMGKSKGFLSHHPAINGGISFLLKPGMTLYELLRAIHKPGIGGKVAGVGRTLVGGTADGASLKGASVMIGTGVAFTGYDRFTNDKIPKEELFASLSDVNNIDLNLMAEIMVRGLAGWANLLIK